MAIERNPGVENWWNQQRLRLAAGAEEMVMASLDASLAMATANMGRPMPAALPHRTTVLVSSGSGVLATTASTSATLLVENKNFIYTGDRTLETDEDCCGVSATGPYESVTVSNCSFTGFRQGIVVTATSPATVQLLHVVDSEVNDVLRNGVLSQRCDKTKIRRSIFWKCGEADLAYGGVHVAAEDSGPDVIVSDCAVVEPGAFGVKLETGGLAERNLIARCSIGMQMGGGAVLPSFGGVFGSMSDNVIVEGDNVAVATLSGIGIKLANSNSCHLFNNLLWQNAGTDPISLFLNGLNSDGGGVGVGVKNTIGNGNRALNWKWGYKPDGVITGYTATAFGTNAAQADTVRTLVLDAVLGADWITKLKARALPVSLAMAKILLAEP